MDFSEKYLSFDEYQSLGGTCEEAPFNLLEYDARKEVDKQTFGRLINLEDQKQEVKLCVFELIELQLSINNGVDVSGNVINYPSEQIVKSKNDIIKRCLLNCKLEDGTPYLYRGV